MINDKRRYCESIKKTIECFDFEKLRNTKILITGANGMIGSALVDIINYMNEKQNMNIRLYPVVRSKERFLERFGCIKNIDIITQDVTIPFTQKYDIDYIIHAASNAHPKNFINDPVGTMTANFIGLKNILDYALNNNVKRVLYVSSGEIYSQAEENVKSFTEEYIGKTNPLSIRSCYPISKMASETLCVSYSEQYGIDTIIARPCHIYGPTQSINDSRAVSDFIRKVVEDEDIVMKSDGSQRRTYCYVLDCATAILTLLIKGNKNEAYNISNMDSIVSIKELANIIANAGNKKVIITMPDAIEKRGYNPVLQSILDDSKLKSLGWKPKWGINEGIQDTIEIMK